MYRLQLGECVIQTAGVHNNRPTPSIPRDLKDVPERASLSDYFW